MLKFNITSINLDSFGGYSVRSDVDSFSDEKIRNETYKFNLDKINGIQLLFDFDDMISTEKGENIEISLTYKKKSLLTILIESLIAGVVAIVIFAIICYICMNTKTVVYDAYGNKIREY